MRPFLTILLYAISLQPCLLSAQTIFSRRPKLIQPKPILVPQASVVPPKKGYDIDPYDLLFLLEDAKYKGNELTQEVKPNVNFINTFGFSAEKVVTNIDFDHSHLINGPFYMKLFAKSGDVKPCAFFFGEFKEGYADGFGYLTAYDAAKDICYNTRAGDWKKGVYPFEKQTQLLIQKSEKNIDYSLFGLDTNRMINKKVRLNKSFWRTDLLNSKLDNGCDLQYLVSFSYNGQPKSLELGVLKKDFFNLDSTYLKRNNATSQSPRRFTKSVPNDILGRSIDFLKEYSSRIETRPTQWYDDYFSFDQTSWRTDYTETCLSDYEKDYMNPDLMDYMLAGNYTLSSTIVTVTYKTDDSSANKNAGRYYVRSEKQCNGTRTYKFKPWRENMNTSTKDEAAFISYPAILDQIFNLIYSNLSAEDKNRIQQSREKTKQLADVATEKKNLYEDSLAKMKLEAIFTRVASSHDFDDTAEDKRFTGVWYEEKYQILFWIYPNERNTLYSASMKYPSLYYGNTYLHVNHSEIKDIDL